MAVALYRKMFWGTIGKEYGTHPALGCALSSSCDVRIMWFLSRSIHGTAQTHQMMYHCIVKKWKPFELFCHGREETLKPILTQPISCHWERNLKANLWANKIQVDKQFRQTSNASLSAVGGKDCKTFCCGDPRWSR